MLNEFLEFQAYISTPKSRNPRLQPYLLTGFFDDECYLIGIEKIMTLIARAFIFSEGNLVYGDVISNELIEDTIELLHRWTGFSDTETRKRTDNEKLDEWMKKYNAADSWLKKYWFYQYNNVGSRKSKLTSDKLWENLEAKWNYSLNLPLDYMAGRITYRNIIANALEEGPLRNRYLVFKKDTNSKKLRNKNEQFKYLFDKSSRQVESLMKLMKIIAVYLVNREKQPNGQSEVVITNSELANWQAKDDGKKGIKDWYPQNALWNEKQVYKRFSLIRNCIKLYVSEEYLMHFGFQLIDASKIQTLENKRDYWVLEDKGHGIKKCWSIK